MVPQGEQGVHAAGDGGGELGGVAVGLVLVALGAGGIKTSSTTVVGSLYDRNDPRCDAGFSIFYMGINIGALVGQIGMTYSEKVSFYLVPFDNATDGWT